MCYHYTTGQTAAGKYLWPPRAQRKFCLRLIRLPCIRYAPGVQGGKGISIFSEARSGLPQAEELVVGGREGRRTKGVQNAIGKESNLRIGRWDQVP
jgi:hypothetical protein